MAGATRDGFWFDFEAIYVFGRGMEASSERGPRFSVLEYRTVVGQGHGCQKPEPLIETIIDGYSQPGEVVLDPFMGTGTTIRAAKDTGRRAIGVEINERFCEITANRLRQGVLI